MSQWYRYHYTDAELALSVARIKDSGAERVWAYFNNDSEGYAIKNARGSVSSNAQRSNQQETGRTLA